MAFDIFTIFLDIPNNYFPPNAIPSNSLSLSKEMTDNSTEASNPSSISEMPQSEAAKPCKNYCFIDYL